MFGSPILDVIIGMVFIYLLLSIICTAANEMIAGLFALRARNLAKGIANLLSDSQTKGLDKLFYDHPLIKGLYRGKRKPSYIQDRTFALAFLDGIAPFQEKGGEAISHIREAVQGLNDGSELKRLLSIFLQQAGDDFSKLQSSIETWFNDSMSRVQGWYKRKSQMITVILAVLFVGAANADTLMIAAKLYTDTTLRAAIVAQAQEYIEAAPETEVPESEPTDEPAQGLEAPKTKPANEPLPSNAPEDQAVLEPSETANPAEANRAETYTKTLETLHQLSLPLGWEAIPPKDEWALKIIGLLLTIFAVSLGSPFWFDVLRRIIKIRSSGATPEEIAREENRKRPE